MEAIDRSGEVRPAQPPQATLTVAAVARRLGVAPPTLRTWDRRYGLGPSAHTAGAHRRYSAADVARLMVMRRLTLEGVSPADAAKIALATTVSDDGRPTHTPADGLGVDTLQAAVQVVGAEDPRPVERENDGPDSSDSSDRSARESARESYGDVLTFDWPAAGTSFDDPAVEVREPDDDPADDATDDPDGAEARSGDEPEPRPGRPDRADRSDRGGALTSVPTGPQAPGGRVVALSGRSAQDGGLARAAMDLDTHGTYRILVDALRREGVVAVWNSMVVPVLRGLGERVRVTGDGIDVEHAFSETVLAALRGISFGFEPSRSSPAVLLACADSEYHSLPLHAVSAALAEHDVPTRMLGTGLPPHALAAAVRRTGPTVVVLFARLPGADARDTDELRGQSPAPTLILAGPGWQREGALSGPVRSASSLAEAVTEVLRALRA